MQGEQKAQVSSRMTNEHDHPANATRGVPKANWGFENRRLGAKIAGIRLAIFELGFGLRTRIWDYDRILEGGFRSGRGQPCRYSMQVDP